MVSATSRSSCAVPIRPATAATCESIQRAASTVSAGEVWMVVSATSRARQDGTAPAWTCAQRRGRRWRSSRAWPMSFFAAVDEMPRTAPSSAMQNSATSGQPGPAMGSSCSQPGTVNAAAVWMDSGGWRSAQRAATSRSSAAAWSSAALRSRASASRAEAERSSSTLSPTCSSVSIMCLIIGESTDNQRRSTACVRATPRAARRAGPRPRRRCPRTRRWRGTSSRRRRPRRRCRRTPPP